MLMASGTVLEQRSSGTRYYEGQRLESIYILQEKPACTTHTRFLEAAWSNLSLTVPQDLPGLDTPEKGPPSRCALCRHPWVDCSLLSAPVPPKKGEGYLQTKR